MLERRRRKRPVKATLPCVAFALLRSVPHFHQSNVPGLEAAGALASGLPSPESL